MKLPVVIAVVLVAFCLVSTCDSREPVKSSQPAVSRSADWPRFRGPDGAGVSAEKGLPAEWSDAKNIVWKVPLPGPGTSSPITYRDRIYLTCFTDAVQDPENTWAVNVKRHLLCLDRKTGKTLWEVAVPSKVIEQKLADFVGLHGYASSTPAADDSGVYVFYGMTGAYACTHEGKPKWELSCGTTDKAAWGSAASPVIAGDVVIINADVHEGGLVGIHKNTGRKIWQVDTAANSRSTPLVLKTGRSTELLFHRTNAGPGVEHTTVGAVDPATGKLLWECRALDGYLNPSPVAHEGISYWLSAGAAIAIRGGGRGDVTRSHKLWEVNKGSEICTPVFHEGHLYWANEESGIAYCVNTARGEIVCQDRIEPRPGRIYASGVIADGKLYYVSRENGTFVLAARPKYELLAHNTLASDSSVFNATPAISRGQLLLRSDKALYCIGLK